IIWDVVLGIVGSFLGGFIFSVLFGTQPTGLVISFIVALLGAVVLVAIVHMIKREPIRTAWARTAESCRHNRRGGGAGTAGGPAALPAAGRAKPPARPARFVPLVLSR